MRRISLPPALTVALLLLLATGTAHATCPNTTSPGFRSYLPDCRAYELVTPPYKEGMTVSTSAGAVSQNGSRLIVNGLGSFSGTKSQGFFNAFYELNRNEPSGSSPGGWTSSPLETPVIATYPRFEERASGDDLTRTLWEPRSPDLASEDIYVSENGGASVAVGPGGPPDGLEPRLNLVGASDDLSHLLFEDRAPNRGEGAVNLWPEDPTEGEGQYSLYEYVGTGNTEPQLVGVSNKGKVASIGDSHFNQPVWNGIWQWRLQPATERLVQCGLTGRIDGILHRRGQALQGSV